MTLVSPTNAPPHAELSEHRLAELVRRTFGAELVVQTMPGGASTRRYFRLLLPDSKSAVAIFDPDGGRPGEVQKTYDGGRWPFLEVRDLLFEHGVDVPEILVDDTEHGWLIIEDLGDDTLAKWLLKNPGEREGLYKRAVGDLARAQNELASLAEGSVLASRSFDFELLRWELEHFREWALDARDKRLVGDDHARWSEIADRLARRVAALPSGFVHRDYQSRNLMVVPRGDGSARLVWIDFQDAVLGPRVYDLVSLLNDSHQDFDRAFVEARLEDYADAAALSRGFTPESRSRLAGEFDLVTLQRKLKDAGRFVYVDRKHGNTAFLRFVAPAIRKIASALDRLAPHDPDMKELRAILERALGDEIR